MTVDVDRSVGHDRFLFGWFSLAFLLFKKSLSCRSFALEGITCHFEEHLTHKWYSAPFPASLPMPIKSPILC